MSSASASRSRSHSPSPVSRRGSNSPSFHRPSAKIVLPAPTLKSPPRRDILEAVEGGARGLLVTLLNLFNTDGEAKFLAYSEFASSAAALGYDTSENAWAQLCTRFNNRNAAPPSPGKDGPAAGTEEQLDLRLMGEHFRNRYDNLLEDLLRQQMRGLMHLAARVTGLEEAMYEVQNKGTKERELKLQRVVRYWRNGTIVPIFDAWKRVAKEQRETKLRTARLWRNQTMAAMWRSWVGMVEEVKHNRQVVAQVLGRIRNREIATAFAAWHNAVIEAVAARNAEEEAERRRWEIAAQALAKMLNRAVAVAFEGWKQSVEEVKRNRDIVARVLGKMRMREAAQAYYAWCEVVEERKRNREIVAKIVGKMRMREAAQAYYAWCEMVEEVKHNRQVVAQVLGRIRNREIATAFAAWHNAVIEAVAARNAEEEAERRRWEIAAQALAKMLNRAVAVAFEGWKQSVEEVKRNRDIVARVLGKMRMREAAQAYYAWCEVVEERKRNREIVAKIVGKMRMREAAQAYYAWCEMVEERKHNRDIVNKIVGKMRNRELALAFFTWRDAAVEAINERKEMFRKASNFATQLFLDRERHLLMMVFDAWRDQAQSSKHSRFRASLIAARMLNSLLGRCFDAWLDYISIHVVEEKRILRRAAYAIGPGRLLALVFRTWHANIVEEVYARRSMEEREAQDKHIKETVAAQLDEHLAEKAVAIRETIVMDSPLQNDLHRIGQSIHNFEARLASLPAELDAQLAKIAKMAADEMERRKRDEALRLQAEEEQRQKDMLLKVARRFRYKHVSMIFDAWVGLWKEAKAALTRAAGTWRNVGLARAFRAWDEMAEERSRMLNLMRRVAGRMRHRVVSLVFEAWAILTEENTRERKKQKALEEERAKYAAKEGKFLAKLNEMGPAWFAQMEAASELSNFGGPRGLITSISAEVGAEIEKLDMQADEARTEALLSAEDEYSSNIRQRLLRRASWSEGWRRERPAALASQDRAIEQLRTRMTHKTVLDLLDSRYMAPGGKMHGKHIEAELKQLENRVMDEILACNEQYTFVRMMFQEMAKTLGSPSLMAMDREASRHTLRPLKQPPRKPSLSLSLRDATSADELTRDISGVASPPAPKTMTVSKSSAAILHSSPAISAPSAGELNSVKPVARLNPVNERRSPRIPKESVDLWGI